ncbi:interferon phi 4 [Genypterus blacodes]|uniref:interferon phi 4 n=1 Tax=Genypterus blacodes TaxID=154954 RepID=UPI003F771A9C
MFNRIFLLCLCLCLDVDGLPLGCRWLQHKFREHSVKSITLLETMANSTNTNTTQDADVPFPDELYPHPSEASVEDKLWFIVQLLDKVSELLSVDQSSDTIWPWQKSTVDDFLVVMHGQTRGLSPCVDSSKKKNKKLHHYFKKLTSHILEKMSYSAEAWELIRKELRIHLLRVELLALSSN